MHITVYSANAFAFVPTVVIIHAASFDVVKLPCIQTLSNALQGGGE